MQSNEHNLYDDTFNLLTGWFKGHMARHAYTSSKKGKDPDEGPRLWKEFIASVGDNYAYWRERKNLANHAQEIKDLLPNYVSLIEIGPGSDQAIENKTVKLLEVFNNAAAGDPANKVQQYIAYDINENFAKRATQIVYDKFKISYRPQQGDFTNDETISKIKTSASPVMMVLGGTLFNAPTVRGVKSTKIMEGYLENMAKMIGPGGHLVITQDTNESEESRNAYRHTACKNTAMSILKKMQSDLPLKGLDSNDFHFEVDWDEDNHLLSMNAMYHNPEDKKITMGGRSWDLSWGKKMSLVNAFKLPTRTFKDMAENAGYDVVRSFDDNDGIVIHVLKVQEPKRLQQYSPGHYQNNSSYNNSSYYDGNNTNHNFSPAPQ